MHFRNPNLRKRSCVGRPTGSRSIGLTRLRRINPNIELSSQRMGVECGISGCAVRLKDQFNLDFHRKCHREGTCNLFECPECSNAESQSSNKASKFGSWQRLALHLWRLHRLDMELYSCPNCSTFRSFTRYYPDLTNILKNSKSEY